jgi:hydroxypyruvate isomerase
MSNIQDSLAEIATKITVQVAEVLSSASKDMEPAKRAAIDEMIQTQLPDVILNTLYKTTALHSEKGIDHLRENLDYYVLQFAERFVKNDM